MGNHWEKGMGTSVGRGVRQGGCVWACACGGGRCVGFVLGYKDQIYAAGKSRGKLSPTVIV